MVGCWDQTEIEDLAIVVGVAIDKPKTAEERKRKRVRRNLSYEKHRLTVTQQLLFHRRWARRSRPPVCLSEAYSNIASRDTLFQIAASSLR